MATTALDFPYRVGDGESAARFVAHWLQPVQGLPCAVDSRRIDGQWIHQTFERNPDRLALRARLALARHRLSAAQGAVR